MERYEVQKLCDEDAASLPCDFFIINLSADTILNLPAGDIISSELIIIKASFKLAVALLAKCVDVVCKERSEHVHLLQPSRISVSDRIID